MSPETIIPVLQTELDRADAQATVFSPFNILSRMALGKWEVEACDGHLAFVSASDDSARVLPHGDKAMYWSALIEWASLTKVVYAPEWIAMAAREKGFKVEKMTTEYIMDAERMVTLPGGRLRNARYYAARARKHLTLVNVLPDDARQLAELLEVNDAWYKEAKDRIWHPSEKALIVWLLENWHTVKRIAPSANCVGAYDDFSGRLLSFEIGCRLSARYAATFTQRSLRGCTKGIFAGTNLAVSGMLASKFGGQINDGPAEKQLIARKRALSVGTLNFYSVERKR